MTSITSQGLSHHPMPVGQEALPVTATWLGRHAKWVHEKSTSNRGFERVCAKVWAVAFTALMCVSLVFIPQAVKFQMFLSQLRNAPQPTSTVNPTRECPLVIDDEPASNYLDGSCDNFLKSSLFKPYMDQLKCILSQQPALKTHIDRLIPSPFKDKVLELYQHLNNTPAVFSTEVNRAYYAQLLTLVRDCQTEARKADCQTDPSFVLVRNFLDVFIQNYMQDAVFYEQGMNFLYARGLSRDLAITQMSDIGRALEEGVEQLNGNTCAGVSPGLFDPNLLGNIPYQTFELQAKDGKAIKVFRCANLAKDEERNGHRLVKASAGEQFNLYLDACQREGKKHFYVNLMKRKSDGENETVRSEVIENLEADYAGTLNVVSLDRNSRFYFQSGPYYYTQSQADTFKAEFKEHLRNDRSFYWSNELDQRAWPEELDAIVEEIHATYFESKAQLTHEQRQAFIEFTYCMIIDSLIAKFEPDSCNFSCKSCIDRGGMTNAIMYMYYLVKKQGVIQPEQFNYLLYLTFLPALLVGNRQIQLVYLQRLATFAKVFLGNNQPVAKPLPQNDYIQDITIREETALKQTTSLELPKEEAPFDTLTLTMGEQIQWRADKFVHRKKLPLLSVEQRTEVESRYLDKLPEIQRGIEERIEQSGIAIEETAKLEIIDKVSKHYLLTMQYYSPVIVKWMDSLLQRDDGKKLVFLARDGIVFHDVAATLLEKYPERYPNMTKDKLVVAWLSRKSSKDAASRGELAERYFKQLGIEPNEPVLLVDTGCTGSIKREIAPLIKNDIECQFSVSRNPAIRGFWDNCDFSVQALAFVILPPDHQDAWANDPKSANDWVEDTHRGNFIGAERLVEEDGVIYPYPSMEWVNNGQGKELVIKETAVHDAEELSDFLVRDLGRQAIMDFARDVSIPDAHLSYDEIKLNFNDLLTRIQKGETTYASCKHD